MQHLRSFTWWCLRFTSRREQQQKGGTGAAALSVTCIPSCPKIAVSSEQHQNHNWNGQTFFVLFINVTARSRCQKQRNLILTQFMRAWFVTLSILCYVLHTLKRKKYLSTVHIIRKFSPKSIVDIIQLSALLKSFKIKKFCMNSI